jgi:transposase
VADKFHVIKLANERVDETRRRVQNEVLGHRGRKGDPLYGARRLLTMAEERLGEDGRAKMQGLLRAGDPRGDVAVAWEAKKPSASSMATRIRPSPSSGSMPWSTT